MKKSIKISGLFSILLLAWGGVHAAGLGKLSVQSALGQPLKAEIELLSVTKEELSGVTARLAGSDAFRQARVERSAMLSGLQFSVEQRANGQPIVKISSSTPLTDPFLDVLIELNWNTGRIIREYTVLLDPPTSGRAPAAPVSKPVVAAPAASARDDAVNKSLADAPKNVPATTPKAPAPTQYGPVKSGDTLRSIAGRVKNADVTLEQMMAGLYLANKNAFIGNNMNLLKRGTVLQVPSQEKIHQQASPSQATRLLREHADQWHAYRNRVADAAGEVQDAASSGQTASGKISTKVEDKVAPSASPKDVLKLSKGEPAGAGKGDAKTQERLLSLEEELAAKSRALKEAQDRVGQLERAVSDMQKLLELKSQEAPKVVPPVTPPAVTDPVEMPKEDVVAPVEPVAPVTPPAAAPAPVAPPPVEERSWISSFLGNPLYIGGLVAALLLSGLLWMMMAGSRRKQGLNKFEDSIMTGGEFKSNAVFNTAGSAAAAGAVAGAAGVAGANTGSSMLLTDFSRLGLGSIDSHEVDPIAEAEVYMAYGRDSQAEEILKEALDKDSSRHEIALKLLEIYAARKDPLAFETTASELYAGLGGQDTPVWQRAAEMGRSIDAENPLYRLAQGQAMFSTPETDAMEAPAEAVAAKDPDDFDLDFSSNESRFAAPEPEMQPAMDNGLDFTSAFDEPVKTENAAEEAVPAVKTDAPPEIESLEFEPTELQPVELEPAEFEPESIQPKDVEPKTTDSVHDDFDAVSLEFDAPSATPSATPGTSSVENTLDNPLDSPFDDAFDLPDAKSDTPSAPAIEMLDVVEETIDLVAPVEVEEALPALDLSDIDLDLAAPPAEAAGVAADFETSALDLAVEMPEEKAAAAAPEVSPAAETDIDPALWEEVNTKLDLARAYLEMGDREGAREILQEVVQEGDGAQKADAQQLLADAG